MIVAIVGYGLIVSALAALAAWLVERAQVASGRPRKHAWVGGMLAALLVPVLVISLREPGEGAVSMLVAAVQIQVQGAAVPTVMPLPAASPGGEANGGSLNAWLAALWALTSTALVGAYAFSAWRLSRRARTWRSASIGSLPVSVAPDVGPAVFGWLRARVVFPRWLTEAPEEVQRLALAHEREHLAARDPQILTVAMLLGALLPWNLPLLWMLRRLRFAMEVDCDARVIHRGADPNDYGLALLYVSERQSRAPLTAIALIERKSQLERRINFMFATPRRYSAVVAGFCLALAGGCLYAAGQLQAPGLTVAKVVLKPPPDNNRNLQLGQRFEVLLREKYPELLGGNFEGIPVIVALLNEDWSVAQSARAADFVPGSDSKTDVTSERFGVIGLTPQDLPFEGMMNVQVAPKKIVLMVYSERVKPGAPVVSNAFPDTRKLDRELFAQEFPDSTDGVVADSNHWVLLDRSGAVLRKGVEPTQSSLELYQALEQRYPGIDTQEVTVTGVTDEAGGPLVDAAGKKLALWSVWLAPGSPLPKD